MGSVTKRFVLRLPAPAQRNRFAPGQSVGTALRVNDLEIALNAHGTVVQDGYFGWHRSDRSMCAIGFRETKRPVTSLLGMADVQTAHIPVRDLMDYISEQMTVDLERRVSNHLEECDDCCVILDQIDDMSDDGCEVLDLLAGLDDFDEDTRLS